MANGTSLKLSENTYVRLGAVIVACGFLVTVISGEVAWRTNLTRDLQDFRKDFAELKATVVGRSTEGWHRGDMELWCLRAQQFNPDWSCPRPYEQNLVNPKPDRIGALTP